MKGRFPKVDNDESVYINEELLKGEVDGGLDRALEITDSLATEANDIMSSVSDIISLAPLSMQEFAEHVMTAKSYIYDYVLGNLYNLDAARESALVQVLGTMKLVHDYLRSVDISFKDKASIEEFKPIDAFALSGFGKFQRKEDYISEETLDKLNPNKVKECEEGNQKGYGGFSIVHGSVDVCVSDQEAMNNAAMLEFGNPLFSGLRDVQRLYTGVDPDTGEPLSIGEKALATAGFIPPIAVGRNFIKAGKALHTAHKSSKVGKGKGVINEIKHPVLDNSRVGSALKDDFYHNFNDIIDNNVIYAQKFNLPNKKGHIDSLYQLEGSVVKYETKYIKITNNAPEMLQTSRTIDGVFEWVVDPTTNSVTHRTFIPDGKITGKINQWGK